MLSRLMDLVVLVAELSQNSKKSFKEMDQELMLRGYSPEEIEQARARMLGSEATMKYMDARRKRAEALYNSSRALSEEERDEAVSAAVAAAVGAESAVDRLTEMLRAGSPTEQRAASQALIGLRSQACLPFLVDQLEAESILTSDEAFDALIDITGRNEGFDADAWRRAIEPGDGG